MWHYADVSQRARSRPQPSQGGVLSPRSRLICGGLKVKCSQPPQLEADVLSPATPSYLQSPPKPTSKSVRSFDLSGELMGGWGDGGGGGEKEADELMNR